MGPGIIERYLHDLFNAQAIMADERHAGHGPLARRIIGDITLYFADHMDDVLLARQRLSAREDPDGRAMLAYLDDLQLSYARAGRVAEAALRRARNG